MLLHGLCILPVAAVLVWLVGGAVGFSGHDFWVVRGMPALLRWVSVLAIGGALAGLLWMRRDRFDVPGLAVLAVGALATLGLAQMLPGVVRPTYTVADAAASIDEAYGTTDLVWSRRSTSVFLGTTIDYSEGLIRESQVGLPDIIVDLFELPAPHPNEIGYRLVRVYPINLGQEYLERHDDAPVLRVWRREP